MKVVKAIGSPNRTTSTLELDLDGVPKSLQPKVKKEIGEFLVEQVLLGLSSSDSPVAGEAWPALSKEYKKEKQEEGGTTQPDMEKGGKMKDALTFETTGEGLEIGFWGEEAWKADGHLKFSGKEGTAPKRRFLPGEGQNFESDITQGVEAIIADAMLEGFDLDKSDFEDVDSAATLYGVLSSVFAEMSRAEVKVAVLRNPALAKMLDDLDLLELL